MFQSILTLFLFIFTTSLAYAAEGPISFSSNYTNLSKDCKWVHPESKLQDGQDNALICKGFGKYRIYIYFSATDSHLSIQLKDKPDSEVFSSFIKGIDEKKGVVEWRMANGSPFAIIVRNKEYSSLEEGKKLLQETLVIRGIGEYSGINGSVNVKNNPRANEEARRLSDEGYSQFNPSKR